MSAPTTATRSIWLAAWYLAHDLEFLRAVALPGRRSHICSFVFADRDDRAAGLAREFRDDRPVQRLIAARLVAAKILDAVAEHAWCAPEDIAEPLSYLRQPGGPDA